MSRLIKALKASGEPTRLRILAALSHNELTVSELIDLLKQSQPRVSRHLKLLQEAGLIERFQEGAWVFQRLSVDSRSATIVKNIIELINFDDPVFKKDQLKVQKIISKNAELAANYFAEHAVDWDKVRTMVGSDEKIETALLQTVKGRQFESMIDMGTGTGRIAEIFAPFVNKVTGFDASAEMLKLARAKFEKANLTHCQARLGDIADLSVADGSADLITVHQVLHYLDRPFSVIEEIKRLLAPMGIALIIDFAKHQHEFLRTDHAHRRLGFTQSEVQFWCDQHELQLTQVQELTHNHTQDGLDVMLWVIGHQQ